MPIKQNENPEHIAGANKFISKSGEGMRGKMIALHKSGNMAIMLAMNSSFDGSVVWGRFYAVKEVDPKQWPRLINAVSRIPSNKNWRIV